MLAKITANLPSRSCRELCQLRDQISTRQHGLVLVPLPRNTPARSLCSSRLDPKHLRRISGMDYGRHITTVVSFAGRLCPASDAVCFPRALVSLCLSRAEPYRVLAIAVEIVAVGE